MISSILYPQYSCCLTLAVIVTLLSNTNALSSIATTKTTTATSNTNSYLSRGWTQTEVDIVKEQTKVLKKNLLEEGSDDRPKKAVTITAQQLGDVPELWMRDDDDDDELVAAVDDDDDSTRTITKIVHFQRHGQGYHNLFYELLRDCDVTPDFLSRDKKVNPWVRPEIVDSPLTEFGKDQCRKRQNEASLLNPELVVVSPLLRTIQTARISFKSHMNKDNIPWIANEGCREDLGFLVCNKRRKLSDIKEENPDIEFPISMTEEDELWESYDSRESHIELSNRIYDFLVNFISKRPEKEIAVITHSAWLFQMCNDVLDCSSIDDDNKETIQQLFLTSEIRSMRLTFSKTL